MRNSEFRRTIWERVKARAGLGLSRKDQERQGAILDQLLRETQDIKMRLGYALAGLDRNAQALKMLPKDYGKEAERRLGEVETILTAFSQYLDILTSEHSNFAPPPPRHLQERVIGVYSPRFISSGDSTVRSLRQLLADQGASFNDFGTVLDFGCGCGRIIRALKRAYPETSFHGADIDAEAIAWLQQNYSKFGAFRCLPHSPRTSYDDNSFDFIFGISVFTHLPEDMQFEWLAELTRIAKPGAIILLTTHGEKHWGKFTGEEAEIMKAHGFYYRDVGQTSGLPDFYKNTYHAHSYIKERWSKYLDITGIVELGMDAHQDVIIALAKKPAAADFGEERFAVQRSA